MQRHLPFTRVHNFRDLGGYAATDGRQVRWQRLYRSDSLGKLAPSAGPDWAQYCGLGIRTVIDLRYPWEISQSARVPDNEGQTYYNLSIEHRPYDQAALGAEVDPASFLADRFAEVVLDGRAEIAAALRLIADPESAPLVVHCTSGKDRTGIISALVLSLLGVAAEDIVADFARTGLATQRLVSDWIAAHPGSALWPGYGQAPPELMRRFLADLARDYGSVREYCSDQLGLEPDAVAAMRAYLLT